MSSSTVRRRLAAVVVLDVVGYSALMAADEEGTHAALMAHRNEIDPIVLNHGGRIVKGTGDGALLEFPSAVEAVLAAIETQRLMADRNRVVPPGRRMELRIGINLGDVMVEEDGDIYGDGVNTAARLEGEAEPGGICVSGSIHRQVQHSIEASFESMGLLELKNLPDPVEAWRVLVRPPSPESRATAVGAGLPTIAVLPFENMGEGPGQDYFVDGLVEDLITALTRHRDMRVISRNSTFAYKGQSKDVRAVARELDATYVVEGSVRKAGDRVRVTAQLIEAETGHHLWADRFDRDLDDIFAVQDEVVSEISGHIHPNVERAQVQRLEWAGADQLDAWDLTLRARWHVNAGTEDSTAEAIRLHELALEKDAALPAVHLGLAEAWMTVAFNSWRVGDRNAWTEFSRASEAAYRLVPADPLALAVRGFALSFAGRLDEALELARRALRAVPDLAWGLTLLGQVQYFRGEPGPAITALTEAWRRTRHEPLRYHVSTNLAFAHFIAGSYEACVAWAERALSVADYLQARAVLAAALGQSGREAEAATHVQRILSTRPDTDTTRFTQNLRWRDADAIDRYREGLSKAGIPDG